MSKKNIGELMQECCRQNPICDLCEFRFICSFYYAGTGETLPCQWGVKDCENFTKSFNALMDIWYFEKHK